MTVQQDPYLAAYLRRPRIPDTVVVAGPGDQRKTMVPSRRRPRVPKDLDAGRLEAEVQSFALHMAAEGKAVRTIRTYTEAVRWFAAAYILTETEKRRWQEVDKVDLRRWTVRLLGEYSTAYAGNQFRAIRRFLRWLAVEEDRPDPVKGLRAPTVKVSLVPVFTSEELSALRRVCQGRSFADRRDAAVLAVFEATGIRLSELAAIRYDPADPELCDLNLFGREIRVFGKGGKPRVVTISYQAARSLDRYLRARAKHPLAGRPEPWLGTNGRGPLTTAGIYQLVARRGEQAGVAVHPQRFRHHFSHTWLLRGGAPDDLMQLNGWSSPQMLTWYGASAAGARARRHYDRIMNDWPHP
jgi:site-specific recombinase XerD